MIVHHNLVLKRTKKVPLLQNLHIKKACCRKKEKKPQVGDSNQEVRIRTLEGRQLIQFIITNNRLLTDRFLSLWKRFI